MKSYVTSGIGAQQTLTPSQNEKVAVYQTLADAEADLANLEAGQIIATPDTGDELAQPVDTVASGNMHAVTSNAVFDTYAVISASSTVITGKPISQRSVIKIMFTSAISGSNTTTAMSISYNGTSYPVKIGKNGSLANFTASEISSGTYRYLQAYTTLELAFDGTQFIIIGNPVVLSSADYTIYADGLQRQDKIDTSKNFVSSNAIRNYNKAYTFLGYLSTQDGTLAIPSSANELVCIGNNAGSAYYESKCIEKVMGDGNFYVDTNGNDHATFISVSWTNSLITLSNLATSNRIRVYYR